MNSSLQLSASAIGRGYIETVACSTSPLGLTVNLSARYTLYHNPLLHHSMNQSSDQMLHDILETVNFIKDNAATKTELTNGLDQVEACLEKKIDDFRVEVNQKFDEVVGHVDAFAKLHETLDQEMVSLRGKYDRLEERLVRVEQKLGFAGA